MGSEKRVEDILLVVPADAHIGEIKQVMSCAVRERIASLGSHNGFLRFRLDGRSGELNFFQWVQDLWFRFTWQRQALHGQPLRSDLGRSAGALRRAS